MAAKQRVEMKSALEEYNEACFHLDLDLDLDFIGGI